MAASMSLAKERGEVMMSAKSYAWLKSYFRRQREIKRIGNAVSA